jgi:hypothetical protein
MGILMWVDEALDVLEDIYDQSRQALLDVEGQETALPPFEPQEILEVAGLWIDRRREYHEPSEDSLRYATSLRNVVQIAGSIRVGASQDVASDVDDLKHELILLSKYYDEDATEYFTSSIRSLEILADATKGQDLFDPPKVIIPEALFDLSATFLEALASDPSLLRSVDSRVFEQVVAAIFHKFNMQVQLTKRTRDGGVDIIAFEETRYSHNHYVIECKHYSPERKVSLDVVQRLYGIKTSLRATKAFLITSSTFSRDALRFARQHVWELELRDHADLVAWLREFWGPRRS